MSTPLLATRLNIPPLSTNLVPGSDLIGRLNATDGRYGGPAGARHRHRLPERYRYKLFGQAWAETGLDQCQSRGMRTQ
jgi:hypothetical protein